MKKRVLLLFFALVLCVSAGMWYLGQLRHTQEAPIKIYSSTPVPERHPRVETSLPASTPQEASEEPEDHSVSAPVSESLPSAVDSTENPSEGEYTESSPLEADAHTHEVPETSPSEHEDAGEMHHEHNSSELKAEWAGVRREGNALMKEGMLMLAGQLNRMSLEEQVVMLKQMKAASRETLNPVTQEPLSEAEAEEGWQFVLNGLLDAGYRLPPGFDD